MTDTVSPPPCATYARVPSGETTISLPSAASGMLRTSLRVATSTTATASGERLRTYARPVAAGAAEAPRRSARRAAAPAAIARLTVHIGGQAYAHPYRYSPGPKSRFHWTSQRSFRKRPAALRATRRPSVLVRIERVRAGHRDTDRRQPVQ